MISENSFADAMDTFSSCFVFASAGSGKTKILVDRFVRHMILGCRAQDIMCVTFTRAAAFEMKSRIENILKRMESQDDESLYQYLKDELLIQYSGGDLIQRARKLYSEWLDHYANLNIVTIHSFCQRLLEQYPIEAGIMPDFEVLDDVECEELLNLAKVNFFRKIMHTPDTSVSDLAKLISNYSFEDLLDKIFISFSKFRRFMIKNPDIDEYMARMRRIFKVGKLQEIYLPNLQEDMFLTKTGEIRKKIKIPGVSEEEIRIIADIFFENRNNMNKEKTITKTISFIKIIGQVLDEYQNLKNERNALDFTDIIHKTEFLLTKSAATGFIISQISKSIKHIMIDEAQDLNSDQWSIISLIFDEIFINSSENNTIFVVGDIKQSIYGFQDADPEDFRSFYENCKPVLPKVGKKLKKVHLKTCYRCVPEILSLVDKVFDKTTSYEKHIPFRAEKGIVEIIPTENFSEEIPHFIKSLTATVSPSDIMILSKNRGAITELIKNIYELGLPTSGFDRVNLNESLIIMDIIALAEICINQANDYALASLLKSPNIFEEPLNDNDIYTLCHNRVNYVFDLINVNKETEYSRVINDVISHHNACDLVEFFYYLATDVIKVHTRHEREMMASFLDIVIKRFEKYSESVQDFVIWFKNHEIQFQKEHNENDGIKFSTIHGSKGLEAPIVILVDFALNPDKNKVKFIWNDTKDMFFAIKPSEKESFQEIKPMIESCYEFEKMENYRLLYVALTRARDRLYLFGPSVKDGVFDLIYEKAYGN